MNTIKIFISCNENIQIFTRALHSWKYWCFHYTRWQYLWYLQQKSKYSLYIACVAIYFDIVLHFFNRTNRPDDYYLVFYVSFNIEIKHGFSCINIRQVPREVLKTEAEGRGFQHLPRDLANVNALKNHVRSLLLHKNWKHLLHFALFLALFCFAFSPMSRESYFHGRCSF